MTLGIDVSKLYAEMIMVCPLSFMFFLSSNSFLSFSIYLYHSLPFVSYSLYFLPLLSLLCSISPSPFPPLLLYFLHHRLLTLKISFKRRWCTNTCVPTLKLSRTSLYYVWIPYKRTVVTKTQWSVALLYGLFAPFVSLTWLSTVFNLCLTVLSILLHMSERPLLWG